MFMQVFNILEMANHKIVNALLSTTVRKVLTRASLASIPLQADQFTFTAHPSAMRGDLHEDVIYTNKTVLLHDVFFRECKQLRSIAESIRTGVTPAQAAKQLEMKDEIQLEAMRDFCNSHSIQPVPTTFMHAPFEIAKTVYDKLESSGLTINEVRLIVGSRLWLSDNDYDDWLKSRCNEDGCTRRRTHGTSCGPPVRCFSHKKEGMINVVQRCCQHTDCTTRASYNEPNTLPPMYCREHTTVCAFARACVSV